MLRFSPQRERWLRIADTLVRPVAKGAALLSGTFDRGRSDAMTPLRILLIELWGIGDVVLAIPALSALRRALPNAHITLLAKPHARTILEPLRVIDDFVPLDAPWTAQSAKYRLNRYGASGIRSVLSELQRRSFDVSVDARMDGRNNLLAWMIGARRRFGFRYGGGAPLLTDAIEAGARGRHRTDDWLALIEEVVRAVQPDALPALADTVWRPARPSRQTATSAPLVGFHVGASNECRRWEPARFARVADALIRRYGAMVRIFADADRCDRAFTAALGALGHTPALISVGLRELPDRLSECDLVLCNDSGPMHLAAMRGVPVVAVYGSGQSDWFHPIGDAHRVVIADMACRPCFDRCIHASRLCLEAVTEQRVIVAADELLSRIA